MANRYWVGGSGSWTAVSTTSWSATSGGAGGASAPTAADSVFFDQAGTYTVTMTNGLTCLDLTVSAGTVTFNSGTGPTLAVSGSMSLIVGTVWSNTGPITFNATTTGKTINTNNIVMGGPLVFDGVGGGWTLTSALRTSSDSITLTNGSFNTGNFNVGATTGFISNNSNTRSITLGSSTISCSNWNLATTTGLTFSAGTSTITITAIQGAFSGGGLTYNNVQLYPSGEYSGAVSGANTFANLTTYGSTNQNSGINNARMTFSADQVITGTLNFGTSTNLTYRKTIGSNVFGTQRTLTAAVVTGSNFDLRDIVIAGAAAPFNASSLNWGDLGNNSGITFPTPKTVYWNLAGTQNWSAIGWATSSGGTPALANFPLPQDTAIFDNAGSAGTVTVPGYNVCNLDMSARTNAMTLTFSQISAFIGDLILGSGVTISGGASSLNYFGYRGRTVYANGNGATLSFPLVLNNNPTLQLSGAFTVSGATTYTTGSISLVSYTFTTVSISFPASSTVAFGTGNFTLTGSGSVFSSSSTVTVTGTPNIYLTYSGAIATSISPGVSVTESNSINFIITAGSYSFSLPSSHVVRNLDFSNGGLSTYTGVWAGTTSPLTIYGNLTLNSGMTVSGTGTITFAATSGTKTITSAGLTNTHPMTFNGVGGTWQLQDALNIGSNTLTLTNGTFDANNYNVTAGLFSSSNSNTRTLAIGSGTWTISSSGGTAWATATITNLTVTGTGTISMTAATAKTFAGGGISMSGVTLNQGGAGALTISGSNTFKDITATYTTTAAATITFATSAAQQTVSQFTAGGTSTKLLTLNSSVAGSRATLALSGGGTVSTDYLSVQDIAFTPGPATDGTTPYVWYLGANSTNSGNNTGGLFQAGGAGALKVYQITNTATTSWTVPSDWNSSSNTIHLIGAGGGGGGSRTASTTNKAGGGGGGGGGYRVVTNYSSTSGSSITIAVGAAGAAGSSSGGTGGTGGTTSWAVTNTATGGTGGSTTATPSSAGGTGGAGTFSGGTGGAGSTTTTSGVIVTGGGGGGAAGPNGAGGAGGIGFANATAANTAGGGGGGNGGGSAGGNASSATGGTGGNNFGGTGGGASNTVGTFGGGGGGGVNSSGKAGGAGVDILNTIGGAGGSGGSAGSGTAGASGAAYGAGGSGGCSTAGAISATGGIGGQGLIVIAYVPSAVIIANGNFFNFF